MCTTIQMKSSGLLLALTLLLMISGVYLTNNGLHWPVIWHSRLKPGH
ncbi:MAG: hypothetical protein P8X55_03260 [Desulfosarcinaceae bacterium]